MKLEVEQVGTKLSELLEFNQIEGHTVTVVMGLNDSLGKNRSLIPLDPFSQKLFDDYNHSNLMNECLSDLGATTTSSCNFSRFLVG